jgi:hypothetical protein
MRGCLLRLPGRRLAASIAIVALLFRLVLAAWHVHPESLAATPSGTLSSLAAASTVPTGEPPADGGERAGHECDLCLVLHHGALLAPAEPPPLPIGTAARLCLILPDERPAASDTAVGFRSRAPPLA